MNLRDEFNKLTMGFIRESVLEGKVYVALENKDYTLKVCGDNLTIQNEGSGEAHLIERVSTCREPGHYNVFTHDAGVIKCKLLKK